MRKPHLHCEEETVLMEILHRAPYGHLAFLTNGRPCCIPINFVLYGEYLYFHGGEEAIVGKCVGQAVGLTTQDMTAWVPSTWRHPHNACPATTFYRSVLVEGTLEVEESLEVRAAVLEAFMAKYQPEGGHREIRADDPKYRGPLQSLMVAKLPLKSATARVKMGQHLSEKKRRKIWEGFHQRAHPGDRWAALEMSRLFPELRPVEQSELRWTDDPREIPLDPLWRLVRDTYWAQGRRRHEVARHLEESILTLAALSQDQLLAYARVGSPGRGIGYLFDVVVHPEHRGRGLGKELMSRLMSHPRMVTIERVFLETKDAMDFYRPFGFREVERTDRRGGSSLMLGSFERL